MTWSTELHLACAEGIVTRDEAAVLGAEAAALGQSPLEVLRARGRISEETLQALRREAAGETAATTAGGASAEPAPPQGDGDVNATLDPRWRELRHRVPEFPIPSWDRYQPLRFLGQGGMGTVFLARDLKLRREVAIKFVRGDRPALAARLLAEARAQARVDHERVCKVYEVGEACGHVYIAMQYIAGEPLGVIAAGLTVEQKAVIVRDAALGIHEAHRAGIIHRDVKPANILVERAEDGQLKPYVMDFGVAHALQEAHDGGTETGAVLGTPHFMSPEQARGQVHRLDRRADIYSLGATLYFLLTGRPCVPGDNLVEVLRSIESVEPRPPRSIDPDVPADLEAITLKCLEKDRSARYDSARALAEDLDRFLRGEPVEARSPGAWARLRRRIFKHRRLVAPAVISAVLLLGALGYAIATQREAATRERLARRFTEMVERIESQARYSALAPLHDVRADRAALRARIGELEAEIRQAGPIAVGPGRYAMGRGHLALGEDDRARALLEEAWQRGYRDPRAAYALALALGNLYAVELREVERIEHKERREERRRRIEERTRDRALAYLKQSEGAEVPSPAYVAALVAFYEGRLDDALLRLDAVGEGLPWFYEAPALRGDVLGARATRRWRAGDRRGALADFEAGRVAYARAASIGESVPAVHRALGELEYAALLMELYGQGEVKPRFERGEAAAQRALVALPDDDAGLVLEASLLQSYAEHLADRGGDVEALLAKAIDAAERAHAVAPARATTRMTLARACYQRAAARQARNVDPRDDLRRALALFEGVDAGDRDYAYHNDHGLMLQTWADHEDQSGLDGVARRGEAIEAYLAATRLDERRLPAWNNLGSSYLTRATRPRGPDPDGDLDRARSAFDRARAINPSNVVPYFYGGQVRGRIAERKRARGGDPRPDLEEALSLYQQGLVINPRMPHLHNGAGIARMDLAREAWDRGERPEPQLAEARAAYERAIAAAPEQGNGHHNLAGALVRQATYERARGLDPEPTVHLAVSAAQRAVELLPEVASPRAVLAEAHLVQAEHELDRGRDPGARLQAALAALAQAERRASADPQVRALLGRAHGLLARRARGAAKEAEEALRELQRALDLAPERQDEALALGHLLGEEAERARAAGRDPTLYLTRGLSLAEGLLASRPAWAEALALRAGLRLVEARAAEKAEDRRARAALAEGDFRAALRINGNLEHACKARVGEAARLAAAR